MTETNSTPRACVVATGADADADGICDDVDDCIESSMLAAFALSGAIYDCGCSDIPEGDCDCDGN